MKGVISLNKAELIEAVAAKVKPNDIKNKTAADRIINAVFDTIREQVVAGETVTIANFGTFKAVQRAEKTCINPNTKEKFVAPAKIMPKFTPGNGFKDAVND